MFGDFLCTTDDTTRGAGWKESETFVSYGQVVMRALFWLADGQLCNSPMTETQRARPLASSLYLLIYSLPKGLTSQNQHFRYFNIQKWRQKMPSVHCLSSPSTTSHWPFFFFNHRKVSLPLTQLVLPLAYRCVWNGLSAEARHSVSTEFKKTGLLPIFMPDLSLRFLPSTSIFMKFN